VRWPRFEHQSYNTISLPTELSSRDVTYVQNLSRKSNQFIKEWVHKCVVRKMKLCTINFFFVCIVTHFLCFVFSASCKGNFWRRCLFNDLALVIQCTERIVCKFNLCYVGLLYVIILKSGWYINIFHFLHLKSKFI
jgi:hypothetical protein